MKLEFFIFRMLVSGFLLLQMFFGTFVYAAGELTAKKPTVLILATGGTIAGSSSVSTNTGTYKPAILGIDAITETVPEIKRLANIKTEQFFQIASQDFTDEKMIQLGKRVSEYLKSDAIDAVVITHGTDTIEETSYFLHLTLKSTKPVVFVGAMRPATALSADGPLNLYNAVVVASSEEAKSKGVLVVMNDEIHTARDVTKTNTLKVETFKSPFGPLGYIVEGRPLFYRQLTRPHTLQTEFEVSKISHLPKVAIVYAYINETPDIYDALVASGAQAVVHAGTGDGSIPSQMLPVIKKGLSQGVFLVRSSRTGSGFVLYDGETKDSENGYIAAGDQNPQKARILMALALTKTKNKKEIQKIFLDY